MIYTFFMLDVTVGKQEEDLRNITCSYNQDKKYWIVAIKGLQEKIKVSDKNLWHMHEASICS